MGGARAAVAAISLSLAVAMTTPARAAVGDESVIESICSLINSSARAQGLPVAFLTRLIWQESNFQPNAVSPAGARGIAQFMPATAGARGLADPFDPKRRSPRRPRCWPKCATSSAISASPPPPTTPDPAGSPNSSRGRPISRARRRIMSRSSPTIPPRNGAANAAKLTDEAVFPDGSCVQIVAKFHRAEPALFAHSSFWAPWGVQISGAFNKAAALRQYQRAEAQYAAILGGVQPMVLAGRLRSRGFRPFYRVRAPAQSRQQAEQMCAKLEKVGGACAVLRSV